MKIGLFFGSFNPIHTGHLIIASQILNYTSLDRIWFVVSPQNPLKEHEQLLDAQVRLQLVRIATKADKRFAVSHVEFNLPTPSFTIDTLTYLKGNYSENDYYLIIGSDNFLNFSSWKLHEVLLTEWEIIIYIRPGFPINSASNFSRVQILNPAQIDISSTKIRELIKGGKSIRYIVPDSVLEEIKNKNYYK
jgi:nicotinate-nucleotide adenylyltransferase